MLKNSLANLSKSHVLRRLILPMFERFNPGNIHIRHHYTRQRMLLHSYRHKGYWFHGRRREQDTMEFFQQVLRPGDTVIEVGSHIGYMTMLFAKLVGDKGRVLVFEPGQNNLPYLRANVGKLPTVQIVESAVSDADGAAPFFEEALTGQNNSLLGDYERFEQNRKRAFSNQKYQERMVPTVRLDTFVRERGVRPQLIKIDIEGAESMALTGALTTLREHQPMLVVEVTRHGNIVFELLTSIGYQLFAPDGKSLRDGKTLYDNICAVHPESHGERLTNWAFVQRRSAA
jgi:FkbM family methyltransferase